jgi:hypothetical protein
MTGRADRAAGRVQPEGLAPTGGPGPTGGPRLAERERRRGFYQKIKIEIELKKGFFLEKPFNTQLKSRKINLIFAKITLNNL